MPGFIDIVQAFGTKCVANLIPAGSSNRLPVTHPVTLSATARVVGDTTFTITTMPSGVTLIPEGSEFVFGSGGSAVLVRSTSDITTGNLTATCEPIKGAIAASATGLAMPLYLIIGGESAGISYNDKEQENRFFESGIWSDAKKVMIGAEIPWAGIYPNPDAAMQSVILPAAESEKEIWARIIYPNGQWRCGAAYVKGYKEDTKMDEVLKASWTFRMVGKVKRSDALNPTVYY